MNENNTTKTVTDLKFYYSKLQELRTECESHLAILQETLQKGLLVDNDKIKKLTDQIHSMCQAQMSLCDALKNIGVNSVTSIQEISDKIDAWQEEQEHKAAREQIESQLRQVLAIQYNGKNADIANALQNIKQEVENILSLSVEFEEFANKAAKYLDFLKEVKSPDFDFIKEHISNIFSLNLELILALLLV